jgi:hypothetical protein
MPHGALTSDIAPQEAGGSENFREGAPCGTARSRDPGRPAPTAVSTWTVDDLSEEQLLYLGRS